MKTLIFFLTIFLFFNFNLKSQTITEPMSNLNIVNSQYVKDDLTKFLQKNTEYPLEALKKKIQGDVIFLINIDKNGKIDNVNIVSSSFDILTSNSLASINKLKNEWSPYKEIGMPVSKSPLIVFRYRYYINTQPPEYRKRAEKYVKKQKYEKALKYCNLAIKENQFDSELFELRSKIKRMLGDSDGANLDSEQSDRLENEIISVVDVISMIRKENRVETRTKRRVVY